MSIRNLAYFTHPSSIALIGASGRPATVGEVLTRNLLNSGFAGGCTWSTPITPVFRILKCYPDVESLPSGRILP